MHFARRWWNQLVASLIQQDIDEELQFHIEMLVRAGVRAGLDEPTARRRALGRFGSYVRIRRACSSVYGIAVPGSINRGALMQNLWQDARYALRNIVRQPTFSVVAISTLGVGIAASTVMFSAVNSTVLNPIPFTDGDRMARVWHESPSGGMRFSPDPVSVNAWRERATTVEELATWGSDAMLVRTGGEPQQVTVGVASVELFPFLGIQPVIGRAFQPADTVEGQNRVVILAERHWQRHYNRDREIIGQTVTLNDEPHTVIGIAPRLADSFFPANRSSQLDYAFLIPAANRHATMVKLRAGVTTVQTEHELGQIHAQIEVETGTPNGWTVDVSRPIDTVSSSLKVGLWVLLGAVGFVLLVACINVANMLLVRGVTRSHELALRQSLGAGTPRMVRQLLVESAFITTAAAVLALALTGPALHLLRTLAPQGLAALRGVRFDTPVLVTAIGITTVITLAFGLVPLTQVRRLNLAALFNSGRSGHSTPMRTGLRNILVALEVAMATVLFVGAGLMMRTLMELSQHDPGFQATNLITFGIHLPESRYPNEPTREGFIRDVRDRIGALPAVQRMAVGGIGTVGVMESEVQVEGASEPAPSRLVMVDLVSDGFFETLGMHIRGRGFTRAEINTKAKGVVVVNETFERTYFGGESAVGQRYRAGNEGSWITIVGVVSDVHLSGMLQESETLQIYQPYHTWNLNTRPFVIRTTGDPRSVLSLLKGAIWTIDNDLPLRNVEVATQMLSDAIARPRFNAIVMTAFALAGLLLATVGVYTVVSMAQQYRQHELGVRVALGATGRDTMRLMLGYGMKPVLVGAVLGLITAVGLSRFMSTLLFEVTPVDPATYVVVTLTLTLTALTASFLPARRAQRVDPVAVLRCQ